MKFINAFLSFTSLLLSTQLIHASREIAGILDGAKDLTSEEITALRPLFDEIQTQYDHIVNLSANDGTSDPALSAFGTSTLQQFEHYFEGILHKENNGVEYDTSLPTVEELIGTPTGDMPQQEIEELLDMQKLMQEVLDEAQRHIDDIVLQANRREAEVLAIDKQKIIQYIYNALTVLFHVSVRVSQAAYCTYSHSPQLNQSLQGLNDGIDCYKYTAGLINQIRTETATTIKAIQENVQDLAKIYRTVASKQSILGKIMAVALNINAILEDIRNIYYVSMEAKNKIDNNLPVAAQETADCAKDFASKLPYITETISNVTTCISYTEDVKNDYDFLEQQQRTNFNWNDKDFADEDF